MLSCLFGDGVMAPKTMEAEEFGDQLLCEWQSLIALMMKSCGTAKKKTNVGVTNSMGRKSEIWPKLKDCLAEQ